MSQLPVQSRVGDDGPEPRSAAYWVAWSTCGEGSQAEAAAANGGREAGWVLLDDLLQSPGVALAGRQVASCADAVAVLHAGQGADVVARLAAQSLAAEVNLSAGAEQCGAAQGAIRVARVLLEALGYDGPGTYALTDAQSEVWARETIEILTAHNSGTLCQ